MAIIYFIMMFSISVPALELLLTRQKQSFWVVLLSEKNGGVTLEESMSKNKRLYYIPEFFRQ